VWARAGGPHHRLRRHLAGRPGPCHRQRLGNGPAPQATRGIGAAIRCRLWWERRM